MRYEDFIKNKIYKHTDSGFAVKDKEIDSRLFDFQRHIVKWALAKGKACVFADCGMGKTIIQLEWARHIVKKHGGRVLICAPLCVGVQTRDEGAKFDIPVNIVRKNEDIKDGINIINYEMLEGIDPLQFIGVVLDESSILKSYNGKYRTYIIEAFKKTEYKLSCTATPAPNDNMELGNQCEFLGVLSRKEMLAVYFTHDGSDTSNWILKGHAEDRFYQFLSEWSVWLSKPSDIGYDDERFKLPKMTETVHTAKVDLTKNTGDMLFRVPDLNAANFHREKVANIENKSEILKKIIRKMDGQCIIWVDNNRESEYLSKTIKGSVEIKGSDSIDKKEKATRDFKAGKIKYLISKTSIFGYGMNFQNCQNMIFFSIDYSYEQYYQGLRRIYRFGQKKPVNIHIVLAETEKQILNSIRAKGDRVDAIFASMCKQINQIKETDKMKEEKQAPVTGKTFTAYNGDSCQAIDEVQDNSVGYCIYSPPFAELYVYSSDDLDMGNSKTYDDFFVHFEYLAKKLYAKMMPGRCMSVHCIDIPAMKERDGYIGIKDFPGDLVRLFQKCGFVYHSRHTIWKDPLIEATRTKAIGLMHKQLCKDSARSRAGLPDYLLTFKKPGENESPIEHPAGITCYYGSDEPQISKDKIEYSHNVWRRYASPVWMDIRQSKTLQKSEARADEDDKHICPLQLDVIGRGLELWSKPGDLVLSPFAGIGSEGYQAILMGRRFVGIELKNSYFKVMVKNLMMADEEKKSEELF